MTRRLDPLVAREMLGAALEKLRTRIEPRCTLAMASQRVGRPHSWLSKVESGKTRIHQGELEVLLAFYRASPDEAAELFALGSQAGSSRQGAMYKDFGDVIDPDFDSLLRMEAVADCIRIFEPQLIPALLQTQGYLRAIIRAQHDDPDEVERRVQLRLRRQEVLSRAAQPSVMCVISEATLRQEVGGRANMAEQARVIASGVEAGSFEVLVLPYSAGATAATNGAFSLFTMPPLPAFASDGPEIVAYQDTRLGCLYYREADQIAAYEQMWEDLHRRALPPEASLNFLHKIARDHMARD